MPRDACHALLTSTGADGLTFFFRGVRLPPARRPAVATISWTNDRGRKFFFSSVGLEHGDVLRPADDASIEETSATRYDFTSTTAVTSREIFSSAPITT